MTQVCRVVECRVQGFEHFLEKFRKSMTTSRKILLGRRITVVAIIIACLGSIHYHRLSSVRQIETALEEAEIMVAQSVWEFDFNMVKIYLTAIVEKHAYVSVKVIAPDGSEIFAWQKADSGKIVSILTDLHVTPLKTFTHSIDYKNEKIGTIVVIWRDNSFYYSLYAVILSILLLVIVQLYSRNIQAKLSLEGKVELIENQMNELRSQKELIEDIFKIVPEGLITLGSNKEEVRSNRAFEAIIDEWSTILNKDRKLVKAFFLESLWAELQKEGKGQYSAIIDGYTFIVEFLSSRVPASLEADRVVSLRDITKLTEMERELNQSRKLEAVGRLAAGIAHEINTPTQYVFSNVEFLDEAFTDISEVMQEVDRGRDPTGRTAEERLENIARVFAATDWDFLQEEIPKALSQSRDGLRRVSRIVSAMKHFSHPSGNAAELANINSAIENTVIVARNEWKYISEVSLDLKPDLPLIPCFLDELNQVILGMIVNSAHAIAQKYGEKSGAVGKISISTEVEDEHVIIVIHDDGAGISKGVQEKIFDPFFTTKELNKGTGQGLAIARDVIVNKHHGTISVESEEGVGTTFTITLPVSAG